MADLELSCGLPPGPDFGDLVVIADAGFAEIIYTPTAHDVARDLRAFASAHQQGLAE